MKKFNLETEKMLADSGVLSIDSEEKRALALFFILIDLYKTTNNHLLKLELENYFIYSVKQFVPQHIKKNENV